MLQLQYLLMILVGLQVEVLFSQALSPRSTDEVQYLKKRDTGSQPGNIGNEFYIGFMDNYVKPAFQNIESLIINRSTIFITTTDPSGAVVMIESEQGTSTHNVSPNETLAKSIEQYKAQSTSDRNKGLKIKAEQSKQISLFALNEELHSVDGFTALPCSHLPSITTYEYYAVSVPPSTISQSSADSAFLIVACSDNTTLSVTPSQSVDHPSILNSRVRAGETFTITLQERETLYVQSRQDLTGSKVESTAPISLFTGHECGNVPADTAECDHLVEQVPPTVTWGKQFILVPTATRTADDIIKVVASEENTYSHLSCVNRDGEEERLNLTVSNSFTEFRLSSGTYCFAETNKPVLMVQFTPGGSADGVNNGDPFMVIVPAVKQYLKSIRFSTVNGLGLFFNNYINVFVPAGPNEFNPSNILVDGTPITSNNWIAIPCFDNHTCGHATNVAISEGIHSIMNVDEAPIGLTVYGLSYRETYAYVGGLKLSLPGLDPDLTLTSHFVLSGSSICMPCHSEDDSVQHRAAFDWRREEVPILQTHRVRIADDGSLCINNATFSDAGNYTCYMSGEPYPFQLSVIGGIIVEPPTCGSTDKGALIGIGQETAYLDNSTEALQVCCRVQGPPGTTVSWFHDGAPISEGMRDYEIGNAYLRYSGSLLPGCVTFICQANFTSIIPVVFESTEVCIGSNSAPTIVNITGRMSVLEYSSVSYQCSADGFPRPIRVWTADRDKTDYLPPTATDHGNGTLTISNVTEIDGRRKYCCDVSNEHGRYGNCIIPDILIPPELVKDISSPMLSVSIPFGATLPMENPQNVTLIIGQNIMIPETYNLLIECKISRANPKPVISWLRGNETIQGLQYTVQDDGTLLIENMVKSRDDSVYTCVTDTPNIGRDESSSTVIVTVPPQINSSDFVNNPGNCLDLTQNLENTQQVGTELCVRAGPSAKLTLNCKILDGLPVPNMWWLKDGKKLYLALLAGSYNETSQNQTLSLLLPNEASTTAKQHIEGNYTCTAINTAGMVSASSYVTLFGDILFETAITDFVRKQCDVYHQLHRSVTEYFPGVQDGKEHLMFFTSGSVLAYNDFNPGYLYDGSEESILPQTMENMFDLVDTVPDGSSIVFNPNEAQRLKKIYSELVEMLQVAPSTLSRDEQQAIRQYLQEPVTNIDSISNESLPRLSLYLQYKNAYYMTVFEIEDMIEHQRKTLFDWEFTRWMEDNSMHLEQKKDNALTKWEIFAERKEVEEKLGTLKLEDHSQDINAARALLLANQRKSRFKDEKEYFLIKLYPDTWYKGLKNRVKESIQQMQFQLTRLKTEIQILEITSRYLDKETQKREALNALFPSLDPILQLYCELDEATYQLEEIVKESENMRYECLITGNPADCHLYWDLQEHIRDAVVGNYTELYWYVHTVQAALNHREYSIPAISSTINDIQIQVNHIQTSLNIALSELAEREKEADDDRDFLSDFVYNPDDSSSDYNFELPSSLVGRLLWYIIPDSTALLPKEELQRYNLTINHLNTALTNVSAKLMTVNIHRRWFKSAIFDNKHLSLKGPVMVSPGVIYPPELFREIVMNGTYRLPLYPSSLLLATDIQLTVDVPFIFHTLPTLIKLSYDPHISGGFGPFSFGPMHKASAGNIKFRVGVRENKITITIPGTQLIGYVCDVVPQHPEETLDQGHRSARSVYHTNARESEFDQWLFFERKSHPAPTQEQIFQKDTGLQNTEHSFDSSLGGDTKFENVDRKEEDNLEMLIVPTLPFSNIHTDSEMSAHYNFNTNNTRRHVTNNNP